MSRHERGLATLVLLSLVASCARHPPSPTVSLAYALFPPSDSTLFNIPVRLVKPHWRRASVLTPELLRGYALEAADSFALDGDFDHDRVRDRAVVGTYVDTVGKAGRFFAVFRQDRSDHWVSTFVAEWGTTAGFSTVWRHGDTLYWNDCTNCDAIAAKVYWAHGDYQLKWADQP